MNRLGNVCATAILLLGGLSVAHSADYSWRFVPNEDYTGIASSGTKTVAVGGSNFSSRKLGEDWHTTVQGDHLTFKDIQWSGTQFVGIGDEELWTSPGGSNWHRKLTRREPQNINDDHSFTKFHTFDDTIYVYTQEGDVWVSTDGGANFAEWEYSKPFRATFCTRFAQTGARTTCVTGNADMLTSTNGIAWTTVERAAAPSPVFSNDILSVGGRLYATGVTSRSGGGPEGFFILTSNNGLSWTAQRLADRAGQSLTKLVYGNGYYLAMGNTGDFVYRSSNGTTWHRYSVSEKLNVNDLTYDGNSFVSVGANGELATSTNGVNWTVTYRQVPDLVSVWSLNNLFYGMTKRRDLYVTTTGDKWTYLTTASTSTRALNSSSTSAIDGTIDYGVAHAFGKVWFLCSAGVCAFDGTTVLKKYSLPFTALSITGDADQLFIGGKEGRLYESTNGAQTWSYYNTGITKDLKRIARLNERMFAIIATAAGQANTYTAKTDLTNFSGTGIAAKYGVYTGSEYLLLRYSTKVATSSDGLNWDTSPIPNVTGYFYSAVANADMTFVSHDTSQDSHAYVRDHLMRTWDAISVSNWRNRGESWFGKLGTAVASDATVIAVGDRVLVGTRTGGSSTQPPDAPDGDSIDDLNPPDSIHPPGTDPSDTDDGTTDPSGTDSGNSDTSGSSGSGGGGSLSWLVLLFGLFQLARVSSAKRRGSSR